MFFNRWVFHLSGASLTAQLVKNIPAKNPQETPFDFWARKVCWRRNRAPTLVILGFPWGSAGKESTCHAGDPVGSLGWEDPLEEGMATDSSILAWRIPLDRGARRATVHGSQLDTTERLSTAQNKMLLLSSSLGCVCESNPENHTSVCPSARDVGRQTFPLSAHRVYSPPMGI